MGPFPYPAHLGKNPIGNLPHHKRSPGCCHQVLTGPCPALSLLPCRRMGIYVHERCVCPQNILIRISRLSPWGLGSPLSSGTLQLNRKRTQTPQGIPKMPQGYRGQSYSYSSLHCAVAWSGLLGTVRRKVCEWVRMAENRGREEMQSPALDCLCWTEALSDEDPTWRLVAGSLPYGCTSLSVSGFTGGAGDA